MIHIRISSEHANVMAKGKRVARRFRCLISSAAAAKCCDVAESGNAGNKQGAQGSGVGKSKFTGCLKPESFGSHKVVMGRQEVHW